MRDGEDDGMVDRGDGVRIPAWEADKHPATCGFCLGSGEAEAEGKCGECAECHGFGMLNPDGSPCPPVDMIDPTVAESNRFAGWALKERLFLTTEMYDRIGRYIEGRMAEALTEGRGEA